jgi:hypothetical protein
LELRCEEARKAHFDRIGGMVLTSSRFAAGNKGGCEIKVSAPKALFWLWNAPDAKISPLLSYWKPLPGLF